MNFRNHTVYLQDLTFTAVRLCVKCCCGKMIESHEVATSKILADLDQQIKQHTSNCEAYQAIKGLPSSTTKKQLIESLIL